MSEASIREIVRMQLERVVARVERFWRARPTIGDGLIDEIARRCTESEAGARNAESIITGTLLAGLSEELLGRLSAGASTTSIHVESDARGFRYITS